VIHVLKIFRHVQEVCKIGPQLFTNEMKNDRVRTCKAFFVMVRRHSMVVRYRIVTMDESAVSF
jgi:hypothetical protein